jgi:thiamine-monophosphate kinase
MPSEFDLIRRHFSHRPRHTDLAVGDDAALITPGTGMQLAISTDMLVCGTHFLADAEPEALGWKALAVNLSDLAAMGATPRWAFLALSLPEANDTWIGAFARGFFDCADTFCVDLAGGDTTRGPLNVCVTVIGETPSGRAVTRAGAHPGDDVWVSGWPGRAALGLAMLRGEISIPDEGAELFLSALHRPQPRIAAGLALRDLASAMLDVSDGLLGDLGHLLERSAVGAIIDCAALPLDALTGFGMPAERARAALLGGGDDYELLFTAASEHRGEIVTISQRLALPFTRVGSTTPHGGELLLRETDGRLTRVPAMGYDHFHSHAPDR